MERDGSPPKFPAPPLRRVSLKLRTRARVYFARLTIAIAKVGDYSQSKVRAGVLADLDPPQIWAPRSKFASGFGPPGPNPLANMDPRGPGDPIR